METGRVSFRVFREGRDANKGNKAQGPKKRGVGFLSLTIRLLGVYMAVYMAYTGHGVYMAYTWRENTLFPVCFKT